MRLVFVGDAMEENIDDLAGRAGELALHGVPVFLFQEGNDVQAARAFAEVARLTKGATCRFGVGAAARAARAFDRCCRLCRGRAESSAAR